MSDQIKTLYENIFETLGTGLTNGLATIFNVLIILLVGWIIAKVVRAASQRILEFVKANRLLNFEPLKTFVTNSKQNFDVPNLIGKVLYWIIMLITFSSAAEVAEIGILSDLVTSLLEYLPNLFISVILILAVLVTSSFVANLVDTLAKGTNFGAYSRFLSRVARIAIIVFGSIIAIEQLQVDLSLLTDNITIIIAAASFGVALAAGLAFGMGGREHAQRYLNKWLG